MWKKARALTAKFVEKVQPPSNNDRDDYPDTVLPGFRLRVYKTGSKSFSLVYRFNGEQCRATWDAAKFDLGDARDEAREILRLAAKGIDPKAAKAPPDRAPDTPRTVAAEFIEKHAKRNTRSWKETDRILKLHVLEFAKDGAAKFGDRNIGSVTRRDVRELVEAVVDKGFPVQANRVLTVMHGLLEWTARSSAPIRPAA